MTFDGVEEVVKRLKDGKAGGSDGVVPEVLRHGGEHMLQSIFWLIAECWVREKVPTAWMKALVFPVFKKGKREDMRNYRGISLLSVVGKVYATVLNERVMKWGEEVVVDEQFGFRKQRGCRDPLFILREIVTTRGKKPLYLAFMDIEKAYDSVWRDGLWWKLWRMGIRGKMWRMLKQWGEDRMVGVFWEGAVGEWWGTGAGVAQGCPLSNFVLFVHKRVGNGDKERKKGSSVRENHGHHLAVRRRHGAYGRDEGRAPKTAGCGGTL